MTPSDENQLTADDLAILQAFEAMEGWNSEQFDAIAGSAIQHEASSSYNDSSEDMMLLFVSEAEEGITGMRRSLNQLEHEDHINPARFMTLRHAAHKLRGTAGAVECHVMATIAHYTEVITEQINKGTLFPLLGVNALAHAVSALEISLANLVTNGSEDNTPLVELEATLESLNIDLQEPEESEERLLASYDLARLLDEAQDMPASPPAHTASTPLLDTSPSTPFVRIDPRRIEHLVLHSEQLAEQRAPLESAQIQMEAALQELYSAQARLQQIEPMLSLLQATEKPPRVIDDPSSSLVQRIINDASQQHTSPSPRKAKLRSRTPKENEPLRWDELDIERYTEKDILIRSLSEAIADVTIASSRVQNAFTALHVRQQEYMAQCATIRSDTLLLRLAPLNTLVPRLQQIVAASATVQNQDVKFEIVGEDTEIDQDILESLTNPLLRLLHTCIADTLSTQNTKGQKEPHHIWLHACSIGNEITIEIGFSMTVHGGALDAISEPIQQLNGTFSLQRNTAGGVSFYLRFPRSHGTAQCLLVRAGNQHLIIPFLQIQRIGDRQQEKLDRLYNLTKLLGFPEGQAGMLQPVLVLPKGASRMVIGIAVDEIIGDVELIVKPLTPYLQRPGIAGAAIDGKGGVLLMLDLPELIRHDAVLRRHYTPPPQGNSEVQEQSSTQAKILVADDSVSLRNSLLQTLRHANYAVMEARDGMEALEQLLEHTPDAFLLDVEMPNLNGYDLLNIMSLYPELAGIKIIMLTSRSSLKHKRRALELGANAYLTKPCPQDILLETIQNLLTR